MDAASTLYSVGGAVGNAAFNLANASGMASGCKNARAGRERTRMAKSASLPYYGDRPNDAVFLQAH